MRRKIWPLLLACAVLAAGCSVTRPEHGGTAPAMHETGPIAAPHAGVGTGAAVTEGRPATPVAEGDLVAERPAAPSERRPFEVALYNPAEVVAGRLEPAAQWRIQTGPDPGAAVAPDRRTALVYPRGWWVPTFTPCLVDLATGDETPLPATGEDWFSFGGWLPDGRLMLVGHSLWLGGPAGEGLRPVADGTFAWTVELSPDGRYVALWAPSASGAVELVDLNSGAVTTVDGPFRRGCQDCGLALAWSPDGSLLAGTDHDHDVGSAPPRIRIVDPFTNEQVRAVEGLHLVAWLADGSLLARKPSVEETLRIDGEGNVVGSFAGYPAPSADGLYLLRVDQDGGEWVATLIELETGVEGSIRLPAHPRWTMDNHLLVLFEAE